MKNTLTKSDFISQMMEDEYSSFTHEALESLYDYLSEFEDSTGAEIEFDPVAIRCEFDEFETVEEFLDAYGFWNMTEARQSGCIIAKGEGFILTHSI